MSQENYGSDWVHFFIAELTSRIVAKSGIHSDRFHLGKIVLQSLKDDPDFVMQIDGATRESETNGSVLSRSIKCASMLKMFNLKKGDVMVLMAPNHLDLVIPFYAGWYLGLAVATTDRTMNMHDLKHSFGVTRPKVVFCQSEKVLDVQRVVELLEIDTKVISFDKSADTVSLSDILEMNGEEVNVEDFKSMELQENRKLTDQCSAEASSVLRCLKKGDVMVLMAPNHLDLVIPFYAGWYLGLAVATTDRTMNMHDLKHSFGVTRPKVVFCQSEKVLDVQRVVELLEIDTKVISFDKSADTVSLSDILEMNGEEVNVEDFKVTDFDPEETISLLISTSGTTGLPKTAALTHKNVVIAVPYLWSSSTKFPTPTRLALLVAPSQWLSTLVSLVMSPIVKYSRLQSSATITSLHIIELIKEYEPTFLITSPTMLSSLLKIAEQQNCDFSSFEILYIGGSAVSTDIISQIKRMAPKTIAANIYGMSEAWCLVFQCIGAPIGSVGKRSSHLQLRLIDVDTKEDIKEPNRAGELWLKGPGVFKGYYNNPKATEEAFAEGRWFKSGDLMYRDENWNYYFVDRIKSLLKYRNHQISPVELETVIHQHPAVLDVAVTGVPDPECGELAVACVVLRPGFNTTADEIKNLVKEKLSDSKRLRGGVIFLNELPLTPSTKLHRRQIQEIVMERISELDLQRD